MTEQSRIITEEQWKEYQALKRERRKEATAKDIGKLCKFWYDDTTPESESISVLLSVGNIEGEFESDESYYPHCRPLTKEEIKEFMEKAE